LIHFYKSEEEKSYFREAVSAAAMAEAERTPLLGPAPGPRRANTQREDTMGQGRGVKLCLALLCLGSAAVLTAILVSLRLYHNMAPIQPTPPPPTQRPNVSRSGGGSGAPPGTPLRLLSLMVWGSPGSFGVDDKELRIEAIGNLTRSGNWDVILLNDLWMRPDHGKIRAMIPEGHDMSSVGDLAVATCDGSIAPEFCSGLAVITKYPILDVEFTAFANSGDLLWDYEYFLRRGLGRVRIEPKPGMSVDLYLTSLASMDYNYWYREHQADQLLAIVKKSTADYTILVGDFNVDPRDGEETYKTVRAELTDAVEEFYKDDQSKWLDPALSTLGNPTNTYSSKGRPVLYDYVWYKAAKGKAVAVTQFQVPTMYTSDGNGKNVSISSHQPVVATLSLA